MKKIGFYIVGLLSLAVVSSCTLSEPDPADGSADQWLLSGLSAYSMPIMKVERDALQRITCIDYPGEVKLEITYRGNATVPETMTQTVYEIYEGYDPEKDADKEYVVVDQISQLRNISCNQQGYIVSYDLEEQYYDTYSAENPLVERDFTAGCRVAYDAAGHILSTPEMTYEWDGDLLVKAVDKDSDHREVIEFEYSAVANTTGQWEAENEALALVGITGFYGKAPGKYTSKVTFNNGQSPQYYAYSLLENGLINKARVTEDGETYTVTYHYLKKK